MSHLVPRHGAGIAALVGRVPVWSLVGAALAVPALAMLAALGGISSHVAWGVGGVLALGVETAVCYVLTARWVRRRRAVPLGTPKE